MSNILKYQNPSSPLLIQRVNQSNANFVKRLLDPNRKSIPDWETRGQKIATHKMSWGEDEHGAYVFPEVQEIDGQLIDFSRPPYAPGIADYMAHKNNNIIRMGPEEADWFTRNYKQYYPSFKKGGRIHIKKKNRGKFTAAAKRAGMGVQEFARHVLANKDKYSSTLVKRANFARNSKKFKHENGGTIKTINNMIPDIIKFFNGGGIPMFQESGKINRYTITPMSRVRRNQNGDFEEQQGTFEYDSAHDIGRQIFPNDTTLVINPYDQHHSVYSPSKPNGNTYTDQKFWDNYNEMFDWLKSNRKNVK